MFFRSQLNGQTILTLDGLQTELPLLVRMNQGVMAMKRSLTFPKAPGINQTIGCSLVWNPEHSFGAGLRYAFGVPYNPSQVGWVLFDKHALSLIYFINFLPKALVNAGLGIAYISWLTNDFKDSFHVYTSDNACVF